MNSHTPRYESSYLTKYLNPETLRLQVRKLVALVKKGPEFDAIAFSGSSGCLVGVPLAASMKKPMILVRKRGVQSHTSMVVEGDKAARRYIIVDDLICSGDTVRRIQDDVWNWSAAQCVAIYTVQEGRENDRWITNFADAITAKDYVVAVNAVPVAADDIPF